MSKRRTVLLYRKSLFCCKMNDCFLQRKRISLPHTKISRGFMHNEDAFLRCEKKMFLLTRNGTFFLC